MLSEFYCIVNGGCALTKELSVECWSHNERVEHLKFPRTKYSHFTCLFGSHHGKKRLHVSAQSLLQRVWVRFITFPPRPSVKTSSRYIRLFFFTFFKPQNMHKNRYGAAPVLTSTVSLFFPISGQKHIWIKISVGLKKLAAKVVSQVSRTCWECSAWK